ncbi:helix-turn-helix domain-containing protein [Halococcus sp. PRR34]|uniref:helix-turn-helix domain-containing protein n=1 Tax=Halococcus sp. PRR34 TaxID=3020830 RepID=UPI0023608EB0|nr:helix-turn-helix domain-containing protein [Halococcus sp. PRR34]
MGFDGEGAAGAALSALEADNEFTVETREEVGLPEMGGYVQSVGAAMALVDGYRDLSETERETLEAAVDSGYFDRPRSADLGALAVRTQRRREDHTLRPIFQLTPSRTRFDIATWN